MPDDARQPNPAPVDEPKDLGDEAVGSDGPPVVPMADDAAPAPTEDHAQELAEEGADADIGAPEPHLAEAVAVTGQADEADAAAALAPAAGDAVWPVFVAILACCAVAGLLASPRIVSSAEVKPPGLAREAMLALGSGLRQAAALAGLDRPYVWLEAVGHPGAAVTHGPTPRPTAVPGAGGAGPTQATGGEVARPRSPAPTLPPGGTHWPTPGSPRLHALLAPGERPPVPPRPGRAVSPEAPLRIQVAGDSFAQPLAYEITRLGEQAGLVAVELDFQLGSGVSRMDFFDWPARIAELHAAARPDVLVFNVGGNDPQPIWTPDGWLKMATPEWQTEYARRAGAIMDTFKDRGVTVYWVGLPVLRDEEKSKVAEIINKAVMSQAARRGWVRFIDTWPLFVDDAGGYTAYKPDEHGEDTLVRQNDGVHLTREGTRWVAEILYDELAADWDFPEPTQTATPTIPVTPTEPASLEPPATTPRPGRPLPTFPAAPTEP